MITKLVMHYEYLFLVMELVTKVRNAPVHVQSVFCRVGFLVESVFCKLVEPIDGLDGKSRVGDAAQNEQRRRPL